MVFNWDLSGRLQLTTTEIGIAILLMIYCFKWHFSRERERKIQMKIPFLFFRQTEKNFLIKTCYVQQEKGFQTLQKRSSLNSIRNTIKILREYIYIYFFKFIKKRLGIKRVHFSSSLLLYLQFYCFASVQFGVYLKVLCVLR